MSFWSHKAIVDDRENINCVTYPILNSLAPYSSQLYIHNDSSYRIAQNFDSKEHWWIHSYEYFGRKTLTDNNDHSLMHTLSHEVSFL